MASVLVYVNVINMYSMYDVRNGFLRFLSLVFPILLLSVALAPHSFDRVRFELVSYFIHSSMKMIQSHDKFCDGFPLFFLFAVPFSVGLSHRNVDQTKSENVFTLNIHGIGSVRIRLLNCFLSHSGH